VTGRPGPLPAGLDRAALVAAVADALRTLPAEAGAVVALSGGPDSTALAYLAAEARPDLELTLVHVRHGLRDDRDDVAVVERHASFLGLPLEVVPVTVDRSGHGPQAAARDARYAALREVVARVSARAVLVGHNADDQAETVLFRAARGTGVDGLAAMAVDRGGLLRPLLRIRRADLRRFVALEGLPVAEDPTNLDPSVRRIAIRTRILPALRDVAPDPVGALGRLADLAAEDAAALDVLAAAAVDDAAVVTGDVVSVPDAALDRLPPAIARRVWRQVLASASGDGPPPPAAVVADIEALAPGRRLHLGALEVTAGGGWRAVAPRQVPTHAPVPVAVPGTTVWPPAAVAFQARTPGDAACADTGGQIAFELTGAWTPPPPDLATLAVPPGGPSGRARRRGAAGGRSHLTLPAEVGDLRVRHRRPGDRCVTAVGTQRVADLLVDARLPRPVRERWPVVVAGDRVVWIPGVAVDAELAAAGRAAPALQLLLTPRPPG
jgi:tRNA(Ile)-lysidine synthase